MAKSCPPSRSTSRPTSATRPRASCSSTRTLERFGRLDILVNNAGWTTVIPHSDLDALTDEIFRRTFDVNVFGTWWLTKAAMPHLRQSPDRNVVMVTSIAGLRPVGSSIAYAMSKAALNHLTTLLAKSCGPVRVNAVAARTRRHALDGRLERPARRDRRDRPAAPVGHARGLRRGGRQPDPQPLHDRAHPRRRRRHEPRHVTRLVPHIAYSAASASSSSRTEPALAPPWLSRMPCRADSSTLVTSPDPRCAAAKRRRRCALGSRRAGR